jgi:hypothetical protein
MSKATDLHLKQNDAPVKQLQVNVNLTELGATEVKVITSETQEPYTDVIDRPVDDFDGDLVTIHFTSEETAVLGIWDLVVRATIPGVGPVTFPERAFVKMYVERNL